MRRAWGDGKDIGFVLEAHGCKPGGSLPPSLCSQKKIWRCSIWYHTEVSRGGKIALRDRPAITVAVSLGAYQERPCGAMLGIGAPPARNQEAESPASQIVVQIEQVAVIVTPELGSQPEQGMTRRETEDPVNVRVMAEQRNVLAFCERRDAGSWMRVPDRTQEWRGEENVSDGAEPDD
jgi:hypothetical protein